MTQQILPYFAPLMAIVAILIGAGAILKPELMSKNFGIPVKGAALSYLASVGIRDVFMGLALLIPWWNGEKVSLALMVAAIGLVAVCDFLTVYRNGSRRISFVHLSGAIIAFVYSAWLLA